MAALLKPPDNALICKNRSCTLLSVFALVSKNSALMLFAYAAASDVATFCNHNGEQATCTQRVVATRERRTTTRSLPVPAAQALCPPLSC